MELLNRHTDAGASMLPRERQREEIASDFYFGGVAVRRSGKLHPALYYKGLLDACRRQHVMLCPKTRVRTILRRPGGFAVMRNFHENVRRHARVAVTERSTNVLRRTGSGQN